ncbi:MgtC/SapB family protein (plasmid) [Rhizobium sp. T1470]|uniref:MgtC/SapB family protein n=1 Tax=unclassified Rhizobium TaxID=2613769 RepID=UPI001AAE861E|nr:MgtC/SapB family protein [Rhizobium sp. T1473]MCA0805254.1 MgtC/SapB family protein [Rhizobium sp. T1473]
MDPWVLVLNRMSEELTWPDILLRVLLTIVAASLIGINREKGGHAAGFRTTVLVGLAACLAMLQANALLVVEGNDEHSGFARMDVLRFALGVLTGVGFIGGGAVLHRGNFVTGVTTAATIWAMTTIGLCFGGGQLGIGVVGTAVAFFFLSPMQVLDQWLARRQRATVEILGDGTLGAAELRQVLGAYNCEVRFVSSRTRHDAQQLLVFDIRWKTTTSAANTEVVHRELQRHFKVEHFALNEHPV